MPSGVTRKVAARVEEALEFFKAHKCATLSVLASALGVNWDKARRVADLLKGSVVVVVVGGKLLWCVSQEAAEEAVNSLLSETRRLICNSRRKYVAPSKLASEIVNDARARKVYAKYVPLKHIAKAAGLRFIDAVLTELLGEAYDRRFNRKLYMVPPDLCRKPHRRVKPRLYKPKRGTTTFKVPPAMARDLEIAATSLGTTKGELVKEAIRRLLEHYRNDTP
jgi:hypothetical protein